MANEILKEEILKEEELDEVAGGCIEEMPNPLEKAPDDSLIPNRPGHKRGHSIFGIRF